MGILNIVYHPDPRLKQKTQAVGKINDEIKQLAADMIATMYHNDGIGLAATQIGSPHRIFVMDCTPDNSDARVFINPEITPGDDKEMMREGCISFPGIAVEVERAKTIKIKYLDLDGNTQTESLDELWAHCAQHETDHLDGITMLDYLSPLKRDRANKKVLKFLKEMAKENA